MKYTWLVEKYLEGELSGEALRNFELEILRKPEVAEEVERVRAMNMFMKEQHQRLTGKATLTEEFEDMDNILSEDEIGRELEGLRIRKINPDREEIIDLKGKIKESELREHLSKRKSGKILVKRISLYLAAASIAILTGFSAFLLLQSGSPDYSELYNTYYSAPVADINRASSLSDPYIQAMKVYNSGDFYDAMQILNSIPEDGIANSYYFYRGITAMELQQFDWAIDDFQRLLADDHLKQEAMWYTGLCYLGLGQIDSSRVILESIRNSNGYYKKEAGKLLSKI